MSVAIDFETKALYNLNEITDLEIIEYKDDEDWHAKRRHSIGGSEVGTVMGLNKYTSALQLYKSKKTVAAPADSMYTRKGRELEELIFKNYVVPYFNELGYDVYKPNLIFTRTSTPWLTANLDGLAIPKDTDRVSSDNIVVEIKWVSQWGSSNWEVSEEYGNIPASYYAQVQDYMYHMNAKKAVVFAMFDDTWTCVPYEINRNESFIRKMVGQSEHFYNVHMVMDMPPKPDIRFDSADIARAIEAKGDLPPKHSEEFDNLLCKYKALKSSEKELETEVKETLNSILEMHLAGYVPDKVSIKFSASKRTTTTIDSKKLREQYPEAAAQCTKITEYTWTSVR